MLRRIFFIFAVALLGTTLSFAAKPKETPEQKRAEEIKNMPDLFIYGVGFGGDAEEAYTAAVHDMVKKISQTVSGRTFGQATDLLQADGTTVSSEQFTSVVESYTTPASLEGVQVIAVGGAPDFERFVYMPKENIRKMHDRRRKNVADLARSGAKAAEKGKVDDALRHLYRSYVLLQSLPNPSDVNEKINGEEENLSIWLPEAMRDIVNKVSFGIASVSDDEDDPESGTKLVELNVKYDGKPATTCTFKYGTNTGYSPLITARDGMAMLELPSDVPMKPLKLYVEYQFKNENHADAELKPLLDSYKGGGLVANEFLINNSKKELKADKKEAKAFQEQVAAGAHEGILELNREEVSPYVGLMEKIIYCINNRKFDEVKEICTPEGWMMFERLMKYGKVRILGKATRDTYEFYPYRDEVMCRSVPMSFTFSKGRQFTEDVTFTFNKDCKLVSLGFGLGSIARKDIFAKEGAAWNDDKKMVLVNFLENYRTAFALGLQDYIESIFDDDAVIIVGHVTKKLEKVPGADGFGLASKEQVTYSQKSKKEYMEQLRRCFASQEFINLRFTDTDVERSGVGGETYALQLKQDYISQTYGDQGYLFLFVDFNDPDKPLIHIRTWQPERNPDLTPNLPPDHPRAGIFSPASF
ncbi:MAG: hypothetical protein K2I08_10610 [Muribaculaceae bacterium]|nr:hypothetical protein [Muribaculaceae bacterium]MDE6523704.1 hypothetical protein [Muribaculaceae bacterium]